MTSTFAKLLNDSQASSRINALACLYSDFQQQTDFYAIRKKQTESLINLMADRVEAEMTYAMRLERISTQQTPCIDIGTLKETVENYKASCLARARQAAEVAENVHSSCLEPLRELIANQHEVFNKSHSSCRQQIQKLHNIDAQIKNSSYNYFKSAKDAEDQLVRYSKVKYAVDIPYKSRQAVYDQMTMQLKRLSEQQTQYQMNVEQANTFLKDFRNQVKESCKEIVNLEEERCELIHSSINQFVIFERSAEMNNKYDVNNFAKLLEVYDNDKEGEAVHEFLYKGDNPFVKPVSDNPQFEFIRYEPQEIDVNNISSEKLDEPLAQIGTVLQQKKMNERGKVELMNYLMSRVFSEQPLHKEYFTLFEQMFNDNQDHFWKELFIQKLMPNEQQYEFVYTEKVFRNLVDATVILLNAISKEEPKDMINYVEQLFVLIQCNSLARTKNDQIGGGPRNMFANPSIRNCILWQKIQIWKNHLENQKQLKSEQGDMANFKDVIKQMVNLRVSVQIITQFIQENADNSDKEDLNEFCQVYNMQAKQSEEKRQNNSMMRVQRANGSGGQSSNNGGATPRQSMGFQDYFASAFMIPKPVTPRGQTVQQQQQQQQQQQPYAKSKTVNETGGSNNSGSGSSSYFSLSDLLLSKSGTANRMVQNSQKLSDILKQAPADQQQNLQPNTMMKQSKSTKLISSQSSSQYQSNKSSFTTTAEMEEPFSSSESIAKKQQLSQQPVQKAPSKSFIDDGANGDQSPQKLQ